MASLIGARVNRVEDPPLLRGERRFIDDIVVPDMLHAGFVRSPHPHAAIRGVAKDAALALPGVHAVLTLDDLAPVHGQAPHDAAFQFRHAARPDVVLRARRRRGLLCGRAGRDRHRRQPLHRRGRRRAGRRRLRSPARGRPIAARRSQPGAPAVRRELNSNTVATYKVNFGDPDAAFAKAAHVFHDRPLAAPRRRPSDRRPRHPRRIPSRHRRPHGLGLDPEGARPVPDDHLAVRHRRVASCA